MPSGSGRLVIVCGLPGSGKTTLATEIEGREGGVRFSPDDRLAALAIDLWDEDRRARIEDLQWRIARRIISGGGTAIIEWGTWARAERDRLRIEARELGAAVELVALEADAATLFDRISHRGAETPPITEEQVQTWIGAFEPPSEEERTLFDPPRYRS